MCSKRIQLGAIGITAAMLSLAAPPVVVAGIDQETNIDGYDPAAESFRVNEARRLNAINRQLELKYRMLWWNGFDPANPPVDQPIGHESGQVGPDKWIYRPVYPETVEPLEGEVIEAGPELLPVPGVQAPAPTPQSGPVIGPALPGPSDAKPGDRIVPRNRRERNGPERPAPQKRPSARRGPREF